eukprot:GHVN01006211.1.p1 GENE.GHVN01006211.1~~GHVN01006211.1.p1  ORF type:complete len:110 (-),score=39.19 GHVN01006211.1:416-745(-)
MREVIDVSGVVQQGSGIMSLQYACRYKMFIYHRCAAPITLIIFSNLLSLLSPRSRVIPLTSSLLTSLPFDFSHLTHFSSFTPASLLTSLSVPSLSIFQCLSLLLTSRRA